MSPYADYRDAALHALDAAEDALNADRGMAEGWTSAERLERAKLDVARAQVYATLAVAATPIRGE